MDIKRIKLRRPSCQYARQVMDFRDELKKNGEEFDGCAGLEDCASFKEDIPCRTKGMPWTCHTEMLS